MMTFASGENIGPYRIIEQLGQGGMATVYKAYHANLDRYVAMKVLHPAFKQDINFLKRFEREAKVVAKLDHPNIVPVYDFADHEGSSYLVMRFIEGETLKARMTSGQMTLDETVYLVKKVGDALTYAHGQGVLHRDIKPSNIMLDNEGGVFVADYGLARIAQAGESTLSQDMMLGTPAYMSPEQARGERDLDAGTDIYSLGVMLYELAVGRTPFTADTPYAVIHDHIYSPLPPPRTVNPNVPQPVEQVLLKALAKERQDRFESAADLADAFGQAVDSLGDIDASMTPTFVSVPTVADAPAPLPVSDTETSPPIPTKVIPTEMLGMDATESQEEPKRKTRWLLIAGGVVGVLLLCVALLALVSGLGEEDVEAAAGDTAEDTQSDVAAVDDGPSDEVGSDELRPPAADGRCVEEGINELSMAEAQERVALYENNACAQLELAVAAFGEDDQELILQSLGQAVELGLSGETLVTIADALAGDVDEPSDVGAQLLAAVLYFRAYAEHDILEAEFLAYWTLLEPVNPDNLESPAISQTEAGQTTLMKISAEFPEFSLEQSVRATNTLYIDSIARAEELAIGAITHQPDSLVAHYAMGEIFLVEFLEEGGDLRAAAAQYSCVLRNIPIRESELRRDFTMVLRDELGFYSEEYAGELTPPQREQLLNFQETLSQGRFELSPDEIRVLINSGMPEDSLLGCNEGRETDG